MSTDRKLYGGSTSALDLVGERLELAGDDMLDCRLLDLSEHCKSRRDVSLVVEAHT